MKTQNSPPYCWCKLIGILAPILTSTCATSCTSVTASEWDSLKLSWGDNLLTIRGDHLPGKELQILYLEAYCRAGSTNRLWERTVIPHRTELTSSSPDGKEVRLKCLVSDGVVVEHLIRATHDEVEFQITAHNPSEIASEIHWAQPCVRVDKFTGGDKNSYIDKCFIYHDKQLVRLPTKQWAVQGRYTPGQVWAAKGVDRNDVNPRPLNIEAASSGLMGCFSSDESMQLAIAFEPCQELFQGVFTCIHSDFRIGGLAAKETKRVRGKLYLIRSNADELRRRYECDFPSHDDSSSWQDVQPFFEVPQEYAGQSGNYRSVMKFNDGSPVNLPGDWPRRREEIMRYWHDTLGAWPALLDKPRIEYQEAVQFENYTRDKVRVEVATDYFVGPQYLLVPDGEGPFPAVLVTWYNSADSAGLTEKQQGILDFGRQLAKRGFVTLCLGGTNGDDVRQPESTQVQPLSFLAYSAANCCNLLANLPQVDANRIGIIGHSFGGKWAMFASCLHEGFACAVWIDPGIVWNEADPNANYWEPWYLGNQSGQRRKSGVVTKENPRTGAYRQLVEAGNDLHELHALMAPRPFLVSGGAQDRPEHWIALKHSIGVNDFLGYKNRVAMTMRNGHTPTPESNEQAFRFLEHFLNGSDACSTQAVPTVSINTPEKNKVREVEKHTVRAATCQAQGRVIDWRISKVEEVLAAVDKNLDRLVKIIDDAGNKQCDVLSLPEDTLGLLHWLGMNEPIAKQVLTEAVHRMLDRLGRAAARHHMYLVVCSDHIEDDGGMYNTAFFLGRNGKEIGRYHKTCPTWSESGSRTRGNSFPVFTTPDLGTVGLAICYDLVMPETARCLALQGADIIFFPTMGGAAIGDDDIGMQSLRVRAAENHVYLVVAFRGSGARIISPRGKILAQAEGIDGMAIADIDPFGGREGGDSSNQQRDMRSRLFRERNPDAFSILTEPNPPTLDKLPPIDLSREEAGRIMARMLTVGEEEFKAAMATLAAGKKQEAIVAFERLRTEYPVTWIDRTSLERLNRLRRDTGL